MPATEQGVVDPTPTFSACVSLDVLAEGVGVVADVHSQFGAPFLVLHPSRYAAMLAERMAQSGAKCWSVPSPDIVLLS